VPEIGKSLTKAAADLMTINKKIAKGEGIRQGHALPPMPWRDSADWGKAVLKMMLRRAVDSSVLRHPEGYHFMTLSPGWVQAHRWTGDQENPRNWNQGHFHLYDKIMAGALKDIAAERGLKVSHIPLKELKSHAENISRHVRNLSPEWAEKLMSPEYHSALGIDFGAHDPALIDKIRKEAFPEYKRGGAVNHAPTEAQKEAGNYKKKHISFQGLDIAIENETGSERSGVGHGGKRWSCKMPADYGYIKRTTGADGDHVDCYIGPDKSSTHVFVINQKDHRTGKFDEHKVILGCRSEREALDIYCAGFSDGKGRERAGSVESLSMDAFKHWLKSGKTTTPAKAPAIVTRALQLTGKYVYKHPN